MTVALSHAGAVPVRHRAAPVGIRGWRARKREQQRAEQRAVDLVTRWGRVAYGCGLGLDSWSISGGSRVVPPVVSVDLSDSPRLLVRLLPGQLIGDFREQAVRIAEGMNVPWVRISPRPAGQGFVRIDLVEHEPLAGLVDFPGLLRSVHERVLIGRTETGPDLSVSLVDSGHIAVQGATRLGKSSWCYSTLGQLAACRDVEIVGSDPSGLLLKPWALRPGARVALGLADVERHAVLLDELVSDMDQRLATLPAGVDQVTVSEGEPLVLVVLEEWSGLIRAARSCGTSKLHERIQRATGRLLSESHKAGYRVLSVSQRQDAELYGGGSPRGQFGLRLSFGCDADALRMLHADVPPEQAAAHATELPGIALASGHGLALMRLRGPLIAGKYAAYCKTVADHGVSVDHPRCST